MPTPQVKLEVAKPRPVGPEGSNWFWNPGLHGIKLAPESFREKLHEIDPDLEAAWNPVDERWAVFFRSHRVTHPICRGWRLLFVVQDENRAYVPLDERALAKCWDVSGRKWGSSRQYFDAIQREKLRDRELIDKALADEDWHMAGEYHDFTRPKVGYGPISESKMVGQ
jgi:hypothetical protein